MRELSKISLIAADWGTSNLRVWSMNHQGNVINNITNGKGMSALMPSEFEPYLMGLIGNWVPKEGNAKCPIRHIRECQSRVSCGTCCSMSYQEVAVKACDFNAM